MLPEDMERSERIYRRIFMGLWAIFIALVIAAVVVSV